MTQEDPALERAKQHVTNVRDFYYHLMTFVLVNAMMVVIDRRDGSRGDFMGLDWAYWLIIGWGFGVAGHAIFVYFDDYRIQRVYQKAKGRGSPN